MRRGKGEMEALAGEVLDDGRSIAEAARDRGVPYSTAYVWVRRVERRREAERLMREEEEAHRAAALRALVGNPGEVVLLEVETPRGPALVMADRARGGAPSGTVRRLAGARLESGAGSVGRVRRRWAVDAEVLARAVAASISNDPGSTVDQRGCLRAMGVEG